MGKLNDALRNYAKKNPVRFHMPGGKGRTELLAPLSTDVTELFFTDNLYNPDEDLGIIHELEDKISTCFFPKNNSIHSIISCGGATLCIQTAVLSLIRTGGRVKFLICDRSSHISLINTLSLLDIEPLWIYPDCFSNSESFNKCVKDFAETYGNEIGGVFVTSPDYYGKKKNIELISGICKKYSLSLVVDNSHGSHLAFHGDGGLHPINAGADISVDSIHKTLPSLTGAALLHTTKKFDKETLLRSSMRTFASTSPSFLILQSIESAVEYLAVDGYIEHEVLFENINGFRSEAESIGFVFDCLPSEPYRIVLNIKLLENKDGKDKSGGKFLYDYLCAKNIICEFFDRDSVILIPSIFNDKGDFDVLIDALRQFADEHEFCSQPRTEDNIMADFTSKSVKVISLSQALRLPRKKISVDKASGRISAVAITIYPPGIPVVFPGELIDENNIDCIKKACKYIDVIEARQ